MKESLTLKQLTQISAYLDDRLTPLERQKVEALLQRDSQFKQAFDEMQYTRRLLRSLPRKHAPRNFTLSASMVKAPSRRSWMVPVMSFVSAAAVLALVVLFVGTSLLPNLGAARSAPSTEAAALKAEAPFGTNDTARAAVTSEGTPQIFFWNSNQAVGMGGGGGGSGEAVTVPGVMGVGGGAGGSGLPAELATEEPTFSVEELAQATPQNLILGLPSADTAGKVIPPSEVNATATTTHPLRNPPISTRTWIEIALGALALLSGAIAIILNRRR